MGTEASGTGRSRRAVLGAAVAAVGVMAVEAVRPPTVLGADVVLGGWNLADHLTEILTATGDVLKCTTTGAGNTAIYGLANSEASHGVYGTSTGSGAGTIGVWGDVTAAQGYGVQGTNNAAGGVGVHGAGQGCGVFGSASAPTGQGVSGTSAAGTGVVGWSQSGTAGRFTVVDATATALVTSGKVVIGAKRSGRVKVAAGARSGYVAIPGVTTSSFAIATPAASRSGVFVQAAVCSAGKLTVVLSKAVTTALYVNYLILN